MNAEQRKQISVEVAKMYYIDQKSQNEIAELTQMSRSNISRILSKCIEDGIVEIHVNDTLSSRPEIARQIQLAYSLKDVIIVPTGASYAQTARNLGTSIALYLARILKNGMQIGIGKGKAIYYAARQFENKLNLQVDVVQLMGGTSNSVTSDEGQALISLFANKLGGKAYILNAPLMVKTKNVKQSLIQDTMIGRIMHKFQETNINIYEIEIPYIQAGEYFRQPWLSRADVLQLQEMGVAGCVCGYYFNASGRPCNAGIHDRVLAIPPHVLKEGKMNIGIASSKKALEALLSVLSSRITNILFLDESLAIELQAYIRQNP